jgi:hypothetical protein
MAQETEKRKGKNPDSTPDLTFFVGAGFIPARKTGGDLSRRLVRPSCRAIALAKAEVLTKADKSLPYTRKHIHTQ